MSEYNPIYNVNANSDKSNDTFDFAMPDIPDPVEEKKVELKDKDAVGFKFGFRVGRLYGYDECKDEWQAFFDGKLNGKSQSKPSER